MSVITPENYNLYTRKNKTGKNVYYVRFKSPDGSWTSGRSLKTSNKDIAKKKAIELLQAGGFGKNPFITFEEYSKDFFSYAGRYCSNRIATGKRISESQAILKQSQLDAIIIPVIGKLRLSAINETILETFRNDLFINQKKAGSYVNKLLSNIFTVLEYARRDGYLKYVPDVEKCDSKPIQKRGCLEIEEFRKLLNPQIWNNRIAYIGNMIAATTGMRRGEIVALQLKNIHAGYLSVEKSYDVKAGKLNTTTKNGSKRTIVIPSKIQDLISELIDLNPYGKPDSFLFFDLSKEDVPMSSDTITKALCTALEKIGIDKDEQSERGLVFHSWRHFINSILLNSNVPLAKVQLVTSHLTKEMTEKTYYHANHKDMSDVLAVQEGLLIESQPPTNDPDSTTDPDTTGGNK